MGWKKNDSLCSVLVLLCNPLHLISPFALYLHEFLKFVAVMNLFLLLHLTFVVFLGSLGLVPVSL